MEFKGPRPWACCFTVKLTVTQPAEEIGRELTTDVRGTVHWSRGATKTGDRKSCRTCHRGWLTSLKSLASPGSRMKEADGG